MLKYKNYKKSRISGEDSKVFFETDLPLAGGFLTKDEAGTDESFPLSLSFCEKSSSVQVNQSINPNILFKKYFYKTGNITTLSKHLSDSAENIRQKFKYEKVADLGCNDFTFLKCFLGKSKLLLGIDPSDVSFNNQIDGVELENDFFNLELAKKILSKYGRFDVVFSSNNFAHIEDIRDYTKGVSEILSDDGNLIIEFHWVGTLIKEMQFPFIYHEHLYYHSLKAIKFLLAEFGIYVNDVEFIDIHGGSLRVFASKKNEVKSSVEDFFKKEEKMGLYNFETYKQFAENIEELKVKSQKFFNRAFSEGKTVYGYGASGQANTLMSIFGITKDQMPYIIDDSPLKHGMFTPKNHIEIKSSKFLEEKNPDYVYVMAYTFLEEIKKKNSHLNVEWVSPIK